MDVITSFRLVPSVGVSRVKTDRFEYQLTQSNDDRDRSPPLFDGINNLVGPQPLGRKVLGSDPLRREYCDQSSLYVLQRLSQIVQ